MVLPVRTLAMMSQFQGLRCLANKFKKVYNFGHSDRALGVTNLLKLETDQNFGHSEFAVGVTKIKSPLSKWLGKKLQV